VDPLETRCPFSSSKPMSACARSRYNGAKARSGRARSVTGTAHARSSSTSCRLGSAGRPQLLALDEGHAVQRRIHQNAELQRRLVGGLALQVGVVDGPVRPTAPRPLCFRVQGLRQLVHQVAIAAGRGDARHTLAVPRHDLEAGARQRLLGQHTARHGAGGMAPAASSGASSDAPDTGCATAAPATSQARAAPRINGPPRSRTSRSPGSRATAHARAAGAARPADRSAARRSARTHRSAAGSPASPAPSPRGTT